MRVSLTGLAGDSSSSIGIFAEKLYEVDGCSVGAYIGGKDSHSVLVQYRYGVDALWDY